MSRPASRKRSRIAHFKAPFILSLAAPATLGIACAEADEAPCPREPAEVGASCAGLPSNLTCSYAYCYDDVAPFRTCDAATGRWKALPVPACNPPAPSTCGDVMPVAGSDCSQEEEECRYPGCEGPESNSAVCHYGQWAVVYTSGPACNPPAVIPVCPEAEIVTGAPCWYDGQRCDGPSACNGAAEHGGHTCRSHIWQESLLPCPQPIEDAGAVDAGL